VNRRRIHRDEGNLVGGKEKNFPKPSEKTILGVREGGRDANLEKSFST